ncbi:GH36-type glycosyl hydrolase domain-containing protein [Paenisporosarcina sp. OV554]|uniref:GH36-type glycosyl hydrolase domain-containing protein n=1 Tax=Paenisporosarcina sp. OV554 TaxID=2135694 RepID=UPI000D39A508|nr:cellobiose phosphorylase [Paenisporosarcina sp. OV554]PUB17819.1 cellobiose phosphorylase [Paenisporosarcina sp. OV554]
MTAYTNKTYQLQTGDTQVNFLPSGDVSTISHKNMMVNQLIGNAIDGSINNIFLRIFSNDKIDFYPLLGVKSTSTFSTSANKAKWAGTVPGIDYEVIFHLANEQMWFWEVNLDGEQLDVDLVYGQDVGVAHINALRSNEAYNAQYLDHAVFEDTTGFTVCTRQNQQQGDYFPYLQQGSLEKNVGYSTDGFQFFGLSYKETDIPEALTKASLANETYQYEFAYTALQSEKISLTGKTSFVFYGAVASHHPNAVKNPLFIQEIQHAWDGIEKEEVSFKTLDSPHDLAFSGAGTISSSAMTSAELDALYPEKLLEEWDGESLLSFFTPTYEHVVMKEKELQLERSHGHILMSGENHQLGEPVITSTSYMPGVFNAQLVLGNTSMNKLLSNVRNPLNIMKTSGQRIYVKLDGEYQLLTMPAVYELGFNYARWIYKLADDELTITSFTVVDKKAVTLHVSSSHNKSYDFMVTNQITMNNNEYEAPFHLEVENDNSFIVAADSTSDSAHVHPNLAYRFKLHGADMTVSKLKEASLVSLEINTTSNWTLTMEGSLVGEFDHFEELDFDLEKSRYQTYYKGVMNGFSLSLPANQESVEKVNAISWWYTHNMLVHYSVPHGLEQYGGAAWGTRDVCQGPTEYFLATHQYESVKDIIKTLYSHQYEDTGEWPQWFMFDKYQTIQQDHSHGDVIVWPLKVVADYLTATNDVEILNMTIPYTNRSDFSFTAPATLMDHVRKQIKSIKDNFLHDTHLSSYGDGDWDDTLQPANPKLKQYMVSSWTVALTFQTIRNLATSLQTVNPQESDELMNLAEGIEKDFKTYMLNTDVIPGFLYFEDPENPENMVHPSDYKTGINYRLLPMTRGMISELLTPEEAVSHEALIKEHFYCPDGVRLMNRPANYEGGVSKHFKRAEQASNFGREIGLQYVHAHIRFVEAMAKLGRTEEVWKGLETINPIGITKVVSNAQKRQSNAYFSSSDGNFKTRYEAQDRFNELRTGQVSVKGGWRIYSSGPGIYMNQLISNGLGIRQQADHLEIDPILPSSLDGLECSFVVYGKPVTIRYHLSNQEGTLTVNGNEVDFESLQNRYRQGGVKIGKKALEAELTDDENLIEIWS